jgi:L-threonylcarbamoyladenylate synthase
MRKIAVDDPAAVPMALEALRQPGAVLLVPTETVYGLIARADDAPAVEKIYRLKRRDARKPLTLFADGWRNVPGAVFSEEARRLAERYCPGAITLIVAGREGGTVGFRMPDHPFILSLLKRCGCALVSTSANLSGAPNVRSVAEALAQLEGEPDLAIDGGILPPDALASTIVDTTAEPPRILRQGALKVDLT